MKDVIRLYKGCQAQGKLDVPVTSITTRSVFDSCKRKTLVTTVWTSDINTDRVGIDLEKVWVK